jgi:hypothetical protein
MICGDEQLNRKRLKHTHPIIQNLDSVNVNGTAIQRRGIFAVVSHKLSSYDGRGDKYSYCIPSDTLDQNKRGLVRGPKQEVPSRVVRGTKTGQATGGGHP